MKKMTRKRTLPVVLIVALIVAGVIVMLYPTLSDMYYSAQQNRMIKDYISDTESDSLRNKELLREAEAYNRRLAETGADFTLRDRKDTDSDKEEYLSILDVSGTGVMGYITIPSVGIRLPIYHDSDDSKLQTACVHLAGTSLPVGGKSTHSVIMGHTGLPTAKLFTDIDKLKKGDSFQLHILGRTYSYEVNDIRTVLPDEMDSLQIEKGKDLVTLVTCTPYGINTHRLLVTGKRL